MQITPLNSPTGFPKFILHVSNEEMRTIVNAMYKISHGEAVSDDISISAHKLWIEFMESAKENMQKGLGQKYP